MGNIEISEKDCIQMNQIILECNQARGDRLLRAAFLTPLRKLIPFDGATFFLVADRKLGFLESDPIHYNLDERYLRKYDEELLEQDEMMPLIRRGKPFVYRVTDLISIHNSPVYNDFLKPQGLCYSQGMNLIWEGQPLGGLALFRELGQPDFAEKELFLLSQFQDHLSYKLYQSVAFNRDKERRRQEFMVRYQLTAREMEIFDLLMKRCSNQEIADTLYIQLHTVKTHLKNIFRKLEIEHRGEVKRFEEEWT